MALACHARIYLKPEWAMELASKGDLRTRIALAENPVVYLMPELAMALAGAKPREIRVAVNGHE